MADQAIRLHLGFCQPASTFRTNGTGLATAVRHCHMGGRREYRDQIAGVGGGLPAPVAIDHLLTLDLHQHESGARRSGSGGGKGVGD